MNSKTILIKTLFTAVIKLLSAAIAFLLAVTVTRLLGAEQAGLFLLAISILSFLSVFLRLGLDSVVVKVISSGDGFNTTSSITTGIIWCLGASLAASSIVYLCSDYISLIVFSKPEFSIVLSIIIWSLPFMVVFMLIGFGFQAYYRVIAATFFQNLGISLVFLFVFCVSNIHFHSMRFDAAFASTAYVISAVVICFIALLLWHKQISGCWGRIRVNDKVLWRASSNLWVASMMSLTVQWSALLIAGAYVTSTEVSYLAAAQRTAMLISFVLVVVNMVAAPRYAVLWKEKKVVEIESLAKWTTRSMIILVIPVITIILCYPEQIMECFGEDFTVAGNLLVVMAIGQFINVATGSVGFLLNMSGHERDFRRVTMFAGPLTIVISYIFIMQWGVSGAAIATAVGLSLQNIGALFMVRKRLGFWPIG